MEGSFSSFPFLFFPFPSSSPSSSICISQMLEGANKATECWHPRLDSFVIQEMVTDPWKHAKLRLIVEKVNGDPFPAHADFTDGDWGDTN